MARQNWLMIGVVAAVVLMAGVIAGVIPVGHGTFAIGGAGATPIPGTGSAADCSGGSTYNAYADVRNPDAASLQYLGNALRLTGADNRPLVTGTATSGTSLSLTTLTVPCTMTSGTLYALGSTAYTGAKVSFSSASQNYEILAKNATDSAGNGLVVMVRDNALANDTTAATGSFNVNAVDSNTHTIGSGGSVNGYIDLQVNTSNAQFGASDGGVVVSADYSTSKYSKNGITLSGAGVTPVTCPDSAIRLRGADSCWTMPAIKSGDGLVRLNYNIKADLGDPAATDDVAFLFDDKDYYADTDGTVKLDIANSASTNVAQAVTNATIDMA